MSLISRTRGKCCELAIAKLLGAKRNHFEAEDLNHDTLSIEVKHRATLPKSITRWMNQAVQVAPAGKIPTLIMHEAGRHHVDDLVVLRLGDVLELAKENAMSEETEIEITEEELTRWLMDLDTGADELPTEFTISPEEPEEE